MDGERDSGVWDLILGYLLAGLRLGIRNQESLSRCDVGRMLILMFYGNVGILIVK